jgi:hypothetical protein
VCVCVFVAEGTRAHSPRSLFSSRCVGFERQPSPVPRRVGCLTLSYSSVPCDLVGCLILLTSLLGGSISPCSTLVALTLAVCSCSIKDLTFIEDANGDFHDEARKIVNFEKVRAVETFST